MADTRKDEPETEHKLPGVNGSRRQRERWQLTREKILMSCGLILIGYETIVSPALAQPFHFEVLLAGLALCGVSVSQWGDKK